MHWNHSLSRLLVGSAASLLAVTATSAHAIPRGPCDTKPDVCCEEPKPGPFAFSFPKDVDVNCPRDFYVHVTGLALQAKQDGMAFAITNETGTGNSGLPLLGNVIGFTHDNDDWDYNPGMRFGLGFFMHHDAWNLDFEWTWLNITNYENIHTVNGTVLMPLWVDGADTLSTTWTSASANWGAHYNTLDIRLGKPYHVSRYFVLNPHFGVRGGWIDQTFGIHYGGTFNGGTNTGTVVSNQNNFWGFGARAGIMSQWCIGKGWGLFGNFATALLFGKFENTQNNGDGTGASNNGYAISEEFYQNVPNMEIQIGIDWSKYFDKRKYRISLAAAYEFHEWWDQFNLRKFFHNTTTDFMYSDTVSRGNLTLNGFSLSLRLDI